MIKHKDNISKDFLDQNTTSIIRKNSRTDIHYYPIAQLKRGSKNLIEKPLRV
jgi:hypothetical protein